MGKYRVYFDGSNYVDIPAAGVNITLVPGVNVFIDENNDVVGSAPNGLVFFKL